MDTLRKFIDAIRQWNPVTAVAVTLFGYFGSQVVGVIALLTFATINGWEADSITERLSDSGLLTMAFGLVVYGSYLLFIKGFLNWSGHRLKETGLKPPKERIDILIYTLAGYAVYFLSILAVMVFIDAKVPAIDLNQKQDLGINTYISGLSLVPVFIALVVLPPIVEEIVTRGFLYTGLRKKLNVFAAGAITSIVFAAAHLEWGNDAPLLWAAAIDTFILSAVLIYIREKTGSLYPAIGLHMLKNFMAFLGLFIFHIA